MLSRVEPRPSYILGEHSTTELSPGLSCLVFWMSHPYPHQLRPCPPRNCETVCLSRSSHDGFANEAPFCTASLLPIFSEGNWMLKALSEEVRICCCKGRVGLLKPQRRCEQGGHSGK